MRDNLDSVLNKCNNYNGNIVRVLEIKDKELLKDFLKKNKIGKIENWKEYLSFSDKESYNKNANIKISKDDIKIGDNSFKDGQILNIDVDIKIRGTADGDAPISETVQDILKIYPGEIQGKMKQIASITKRGFKEY